MPFDFGDVVLVPFPFTSQTASKKRSAVVVSSTRYNQAKPDIVLMAITSQLRAQSGAFEISISDWRGAGLLKDSVVKPVFATLETVLVLKPPGTLGRADVEALKRGVSEILALSP